MQRCIKMSQNIRDALRLICPDFAGVSVVIEPLEASVAERLYHPSTVSCTDTRVKGAHEREIATAETGFSGSFSNSR